VIGGIWHVDPVNEVVPYPAEPESIPEGKIDFIVPGASPVNAWSAGSVCHALVESVGGQRANANNGVVFFAGKT
jgi:hypothetical protein